MSFPCTGCGSCCKRVRRAVENIEKSLGKQEPGDLFWFPYNWDNNGRCNQLSADNQCNVYNNRPKICNVDAMRELLDLPKEYYYSMNALYCNQFQEEDGIDESFRVKL